MKTLYKSPPRRPQGEFVVKINPLDIIQQEIESGIPGFEYGPWHRQWLNERAPEHAKKMLEMARRHPHLILGRQGLATMDINDVNTAAFGAINTSAAELNILGATQGIINQFCAISPNDARAGKTYRVRGGGVYSNTATPTLIWTPRWGSSTTPATNVTLVASPTVTTITGITNLALFWDFDVYVRTSPPGATLGTVWGVGRILMGIPVTSSQYAQDVPLGGSASAATIDTTGQGTAGCGITLNATWSASSASNTITCHGWKIFAEN